MNRAESNMKPHRVRLFAESSLRLFDEVLEIRYRDARILVRDWLEESAGGTTHMGLLLDAYVEEDGPLAAIDKAGLTAQVAIEQLSAAHATAVADPEAWLAIDLDPEAPNRQIAQIISGVPRLARPRRRIRPAAFLGLMEAIDRKKQEALPWRIGRSMHHLRKSIIEKDIIDQFEDLWAGLELLNSSLKSKFDLPSGYPGTPCPSCGATITVKGGSQGIKYAVMQLAGADVAAWRELRESRQQIAHGASDLSMNAARFEQQCILMRRALVLGLCEVLEVPEAERDAMTRVPLRLSDDLEFIVTAELINLSIEALDELPHLPHFEILHFDSAIRASLDSPGSQTEKSSMRLQLRGFAGSYRALQVRGSAMRDPEDPSATFYVEGTVSPGKSS